MDMMTRFFGGPVAVGADCEWCGEAGQSKGEGEGRTNKKSMVAVLSVRSQDDRLRRGAPRHGGARPVGQRDGDRSLWGRGARAGCRATITTRPSRDAAQRLWRSMQAKVRPHVRA